MSEFLVFTSPFPFAFIVLWISVFKKLCSVLMLSGFLERLQVQKLIFFWYFLVFVLLIVCLAYIRVLAA